MTWVTVSEMTLGGETFYRQELGERPGPVSKRWMLNDWEFWEPDERGFWWLTEIEAMRRDLADADKIIESLQDTIVSMGEQVPNLDK